MEEKTNIYGYLDLLISNIIFIVAFVLFTGIQLSFASVNELNGELVFTILSRWPHVLGAAGVTFILAITIRIIAKKVSSLPIVISAKSFILLFLVTYGETIIGMIIYEEGTLNLI